MKVKVVVLVLWLTSLTKAFVSHIVEGTDGGKSIDTSVNKKDCRYSICSIGTTCQLLDTDEESYTCQTCFNKRKYNKTLQANETYRMEEECVDIDFFCQCPECPPSTKPECISMNVEERVGTHEVHKRNNDFTAWTIFVISLMTNLILAAAILHQKCHNRRNSNLHKAAEMMRMTDYGREAYENE